ncbi:PepSY domain-containing protein [Roseateles violae]|uniref:PepSY domain-containing protein n=1 Tax=Roseateles violae TaxID=3058042 RepID=A0ABT8DRI2_9BURK|nr:PepSY domain-containing protein [Pelomonas sp. PFR6]MDN3918917.1 PepSY domain-containing protein [Pelomonas sp. PFR6]
MKKSLITIALCAASLGAFAHGNVSCPVVPKEEKKPQMELQRKLESEGWKVRQVKNFNNCYEVYGFDGKGQKAEAFFHPKTFERVYPEGEQAPAK